MKAGGLPDDFEPIFLPPSLYDRAKAAGYDMKWYAKTKPMPPLPIDRNLYDITGRVVGCIMSAEQMASQYAKHPQKWAGVPEKFTCNGMLCLPGLSGKCTACGKQK